MLSEVEGVVAWALIMAGGEGRGVILGDGEGADIPSSLGAPMSIGFHAIKQSIELIIIPYFA
jgi:hypothetical protein